MGLELNIFLLILASGALGYFLGMMLKIPHLFVLGCAIVIGSGMLLYGFDGLVVDRYYDADLNLSEVVVSMSNLGLQMFSLALIAVGIVSMLVIDFNRSVLRKPSPFHY